MTRLCDTPTDVLWELEPRDGRRAPRRSLRMGCELVSHDADVAVEHQIAQLSTAGAWIETLFPLHPGAEVVVCLALPDAPREVMVFGHVRRVVTGRRRGDRAPMGMAVEFHRLAPPERADLARLLA